MSQKIGMNASWRRTAKRRGPRTRGRGWVGGANGKRLGQLGQNKQEKDRVLKAKKIVKTNEENICANSNILKSH